ncbi:MAG TPA: hypothetical protein VNM45_10825 [Bacillus sp. (in: firmicutes)]|nr:hypothetical protein [Bacillus sp. (in: firmicutes)]
MMDYHYRRMAYSIVTGQRDEIIAECKEDYQQKKQDKLARLLKSAAASVTAFLQQFQ